MHASIQGSHFKADKGVQGHERDAATCGRLLNAAPTCGQTLRKDMKPVLRHVDTPSMLERPVNETTCGNPFSAHPKMLMSLEPEETRHDPESSTCLARALEGESTCRGMKYGKSFEGNRHVGELHMGGDVASFGGQSTCRGVEYGRGFGGEATCGRMKYELWRRIGMSGSHCMDMSASFRKVYRPACTTRISTVNNNLSRA